MAIKNSRENESSLRLYTREKLNSFYSLFTAVIAILFYFLKNSLSFAETWWRDENVSQFINVLLIVIFIVAVFFYIYNTRYRWSESTIFRQERALAKIINQESVTQPNVIWLANITDLVKRILPENSPLLEVFNDLIKKDLNKKNNKDELLQLLVAIHSQIHLQPQPNQSSFLDETSILTAQGDGLSEQLESFKIKRALYQTFAASWPLRITLLLLLVALSLVGWKTFQLVQLGADAREFSENAVKDIKLAQIQLDNSRDDLKRSHIEMVKLVNDSKESMVASQLSVIKAQENLANATNKGVDEVNKAARDGIKTLKQKLNDKSDALQSDLTSLKNSHSEALNELAVESIQGLTELTKEFTNSINTFGKEKIRALDSRFEKLDTESSGLLLNYQTTLDNILLEQKTKLGTHLILKTTELNNKNTEIVGRLLEQEVSAVERINKVFDRVESSEQQRVEIFNDQLASNKKQIIALEQEIQELNELIRQRKEFAKEIINVADQISKNSNWSDQIAVLIEWRSLLLVCISILALVSLLLSGIAFSKRR